MSGGTSGDRDTNGISWAENAIALNGGTIAGTDNGVYPGFPMPFWGLSGFFVGEAGQAARRAPGALAAGIVRSGPGAGRDVREWETDMECTSEPDGLAAGAGALPRARRRCEAGKRTHGPGTRACLALLAATALLALAAPAQAQTEIWSATLTPQDLGSGALGCNSTESNTAAQCSNTAVLSDNDFTLGSTEHTIGIIELGVDETLQITSTRVFTDADTLVLVLGTTSLAFSDGITGSDGAGRVWLSTGISWTAGTDVSVRLISLTAPGAPTGLAATANGPSQIDLAWTAPASTGGSAITGYKIEVSPNGTSGWTDQVANTNSTATTYAHTGLDAGDTRHYRVSAINTNGAGVPSNVDSATTGTTVPGAPTGLTATASGTTAINLSWSAPATTGGSAITGYKIEVSPNGSSWSDLVADTASTATTYAHTGLDAGDTRHYRVSAINANGTGVPSNVDSATTGTTVPGAPTGLTATASGTTAINLSWSAPATTGGSAITGYKIEVSPNGTSGWTDQVADTNSTATTYAHTGLAAGDTRHYRVSAINAVGTSDASDSDDTTTASPNTAATGAPTITGTAAVGQHVPGLRRALPTPTG